MNTILSFALALTAALAANTGSVAAGPEHYSAQASDISGRWEYRVDDGTYEEQLELTTSGDQVRGTLNAYEHGYFSGRTKLTASLRIVGTVHDGRGSVKLVDESSGGAHEVQISRRGAYLVLGTPGHFTGYARPGTPLVQDASGSADAKALARAISGNVYQTSSQASGRGGFVGGRTRLALCANGEVAYDVSDVATVPGASAGATSDMGSTMSRRGEWTIVLFAGAPAVMARWRGTGSSYSLTAYFDVRPGGDGKSVEVDGKRLAVVGRCG
jgi:hypothetical protein